MMLGHLMEWLYTGIGGIRQADDYPGFDKIIIDPQPVGDLTWAETTHRNIHGEIYCRWEKTGKKYLIDIRIPVGTTAEVWLKGKHLASVGSGKYQYKVEE
jgi:hypothetical protein